MLLFYQPPRKTVQDRESNKILWHKAGIVGIPKTQLAFLNLSTGRRKKRKIFPEILNHSQYINMRSEFTPLV